MRSVARAFIALLALASASAAAQQLVYSNGSGMIVPIVAQTATYQSEIYIHNSTTSSISATFTYYGATGSATPGATTCPNITVPAGTVVQTSLSAACPSLNPGSNFGSIDAASICCSFGVAIFTRVQSATGNGFSIEGIVDSSFCCGGSAVREIIGLKRQNAFPGYQTNCFLWNREARAGRVVATLAQGSGVFIANQIVDLAANEVLRLLDVFAALGAQAGDYANARVNFQSITPIAGGSPVYIVAACTLQNNTNFDADFRLGKWH